MSLSSTAIANLALRRIGIQQTIADLTEDTPVGRACAAFYPHALELLLRERPWPFAQRWVDLALVSEDPTPDYLYSYRYPADFLTINRLIDADLSVSASAFYAPYAWYPYTPDIFPPGKASDPYELSSDASGRLIFCNTESAKIQGTYLITDVGLFDPLFADALSWKLAAEISMGLTKDPSVLNFSTANALDAASRAFAATRNEQKPERTRDADIIRARD